MHDLSSLAPDIASGPETALGPETWKAQVGAVAVYWPQIAPLRPERGIVFTNASGKMRPYAWDVPGGGMRLLLPETVACGYGLLSPDGAFVTFFTDTGGNERGHYVRVRYDGGPIQSLTPAMAPYSSSTMPFPLPVLTQSVSGSEIAFVFSDAGGFHLCAVDVNGETMGEPRLLHSGRALLRGPLLSADGSVAVVSTNERTGRQQYDFVALDRDGNTVGRFSDGETASLEGVAFSPVPGDSRVLGTSDRSGVKRPIFWNVASGALLELVGSGAPDGELVPLCWSPDARRILLCGFIDAQQQLYLCDVATGQTAPIPHAPGTFAYFGSLGASLSNDGAATVLFSDEQTPTRAVTIAPDGQVDIVLSGGDAAPSCAVRSVTFASSDGAIVQAWLATPPGDGPFPTVIQLHGGPHGVTTRTYGLGASFVGNGFAFLSVNYRGSTTFGREFLQKIWGNVGHWEMEDIVAAHAFLVEAGIADPARIAVNGGSYGGYLTLLALGKCPELFAAGLATVALADNAIAYEDASPLLQGVMRASFGGTPQEKPELYQESSPITYAANVRAPILVIQGKNDTRCPPRQLEAYETKMKALGKEIEVLWFDAGHGFASAAQSVEFTQKGIDFLKRTLS